VYVLAGVYRVFGHSLEPVWILQSLLHVLNAFLVFLLARRALPDSPAKQGYALLAAAVYGLNPDLIQIAAMLFTETLYITLLLSAALGMTAFFAGPTAKAALGTAALLGCAVLTRPIAILPLAAFLILIAAKRKWLLIPAAVLVTALILGPWTARNCAVYGRCILITAAGGYDLWVGNNPNSGGEQLVTQEINDYKAEHGTLETDRHGMEEYFHYLLSDPIGFLRLQLIKTAKFFSALRTSAWWFHLSGIARGITFLVSAPFYVYYLVLGGAGLYSAFRRGPAAARIASVLALAVPAIVIPITVTSRMRYPMYPFLAVLSALAIFRLRQGELRGKAVVISAGLVAAATVADLFISAPQIPDRIMHLFS
jgi:ABC-type multidrug transport system fused ATPase/permease subunit